MHPITFDSVCYRVGGKPAYLYSGEFHYFRVPRRHWKRRMKLLKAAGGNCVATYVPWLLHEPREGEFVFAGEHLELEAFIETAGEVGMYVLARPGPYQYSELVYDGLPGWLCEGYPQLRAHNTEGKPFRTSSVSYLHPLLLEKSKRWYDEVCPILARHTVSRGGPIAMAQVDNELIGIHQWMGSLDYNAETMGFGHSGGRYPRFLERRHGGVAAMNEAYGTNFGSFEDARPVPRPATADVHAIRRARDYWEFYLETIGEYAATLATWLAERGVDVPIVHNSANWAMNAMFRDVVAAVRKTGAAFLLGSDHYYTLDQNWAQNNPTPQWAANCFYSLQILEQWGMAPTVWEMPGGSLSDWPAVHPHDAEAAYMTNLAMGMKGHNYYIFTGGPNAPGTGTTTDDYDYGASIGSGGEVRLLYGVQKRVGAFLKRRPWLVEAAGEYDFRVAAEFAWSHANAWWRERGGFSLTPDEAWQFVVKGVVSTAFCAGLSPALRDAADAAWAADTDTPAVVVSSAMMSAEAQRQVVRFLRNGGRAVICPVLAELDEHLRPCTILRDFLGWPAARAIAADVTRPSIAGVRNVWSNWKGLFAAAANDVVAAGGEIVGVEETSGSAIAWETATSGGGRAVFVGLRWYQAKREHERMLMAVLGRLGLERKIECSEPNVWCTLRTAGKRSTLFLMNLTSSPLAASVSCTPAWSGKRIDAGRHKLAPMTVKAVDLTGSRASGRPRRRTGGPAPRASTRRKT
jgi:beta-galactosidase